MAPRIFSMEGLNHVHQDVARNFGIVSLHSYSVTDLNNTDERYSVLFRLSAISGVLGTIITILIGYLSEWGIETTIGAPSTVVLYLGLVKIFERHIWNKKVGTLIGSSTPDLNGTWEGSVWLKTVNGQEKHSLGQLTIEQNWRTMGIGFKTGLSNSHTNMASIIIRANEVLLTYQYYSEKRRPDKDIFLDHKGTGSLIFNKSNGKVDKSKIDIQFYTNTKTVGRIELDYAATLTDNS